MRYLLALIVCGLVGMGGGACNSPIPADVRDTDPTVRIPTIKEEARRGERGNVHRLVKDLRSDDPAIRFYAIGALGRLNGGETMGYRYFDDEAAREESMRRWEAWLKQQERSHGKGEGTATTSTTRNVG